MKRFFGTLLAVVIMSFSLSSAAWGEVNVNINVGRTGATDCPLQSP